MKKENDHKKQYKADSLRLRNRMEVRFTDAEIIELKLAVERSKYNKISEYIRAKIYNENDKPILSEEIFEQQKDIKMHFIGLESQLPVINNNLETIVNEMMAAQLPNAETIHHNVLILHKLISGILEMISSLNKNEVRNISEAMMKRDHDIKEQLIELGGQLPRIGNNLNQIAHRMNAGDAVKQNVLQQEILKTQKMMAAMAKLFKIIVNQ